MQALPAPRARLAASLRWAPEWPAAALVLLAWAALVAGIGNTEAPGAHANHQHAVVSAAALPAWTLMILAMMLPVALPALRHVALNSIRARRGRAMTAFGLAYVGVWVAFGLAATVGYGIASAALMLDERAFLTIALFWAAAWQFTRVKRRAVLACKRTVPLPPVGLRADRACAHFGALQAARCIRSCWALMVVMVIAGHHSLVWMLALSPLVWLEELTAEGRRRLAHVALALGATTVLVAAGG